MMYSATEEGYGKILIWKWNFDLINDLQWELNDTYNAIVIDDGEIRYYELLEDYNLIKERLFLKDDSVDEGVKEKHERYFKIDDLGFQKIKNQVKIREKNRGRGE